MKLMVDFATWQAGTSIFQRWELAQLPQNRPVAQPG
jgi:hypothetical protein